MATAGVMLLKGATGKAVHTEGGTHKRRNTQKAVCGHRRSHVIEGATGKGGAHRRRCTHKAEHTKGGLWPPQESCY